MLDHQALLTSVVADLDRLFERDPLSDDHAVPEAGTAAGETRPWSFMDDEDGYQTWIESHPHGFVLNSYRRPTPEYLVLHRATCAHIRTEHRTNYTTGAYIKTCADRKDDLVTWARRRVGGRLHPCKSCTP